MHLFMVIFIGGKVFGFMGPLEGDMDGCLKLVKQQTAILQEQIATGYDVNGNPISAAARQMSFGCLYSSVTPDGARPFSAQ
ncbi:MmcQ/YjbR family DNA-binding protein [Rhizobium sp. CCGE 510]|uniref:MmcQ/YjbR family DNA-binding protein n=1 Tax=Rhizobium sp. CCGE 510 TaxID=1132836 RepID=UPI00027B7E82|nr:MmcQ/YjbR family DNA-binding protein [Rhizobium sp. CCGE 510]EJT04962.1 hypothetical protein RCCGE510_12541 [Rhizobium sp. CCGE 510]